MYHRKKRGSLEISIQAIVIVVLAMTLLGLGLGFIRGMFKNITGTTEGVSEQVRQQILEQLRDTGQPLSFPTDQVKLNFDEETIISIGVQNVDDAPLDFRILVDRIQPNQEELSSGTVPGSYGAFFWDETDQILAPGESKVFGLKYFAPTPTGTYLFKVIIEDLSGPIEYSSKSFFIRVI
jgi:hypothetical protein